MKRFYKLVSTREEKGGYAILLDSKPIKTPAKNSFLLDTQELADAVMQEWAAQGDKIIPDTMPIMQIASTKIDRVGEERAAMEKTVLEYLDTDLVCYRTSQQPLAERQGAIWDPWLTWFEQKFGVKLFTTEKLNALTQPEAAHKAVHDYVAALDDNHFTILQMVTAMTGSIVLAIGFVEGTSAEMLINSARVDENYKAELYDEAKYGPDPAQEKKDKAFLRDLEAGQKFLELLK